MPKTARPAESGRGPGAAPLAPADRRGITLALAEARAAAAQGEVPIGAVVMGPGETVLGVAHNETLRRRDPTAHAELLALQQALARAGSDRLPECTLYVTLEPCAQCAGAIVLTKLGRLVFGAYDDKAGMCGSVGDLVRHRGLNHRVAVIGGVEAEESSRLLQAFFRGRR